MIKKVQRSEDYWRKILTPEEFQVLRKKGTEPPLTGKVAKKLNEGIYVCKGCGTKLFSSETKFNSGSGWPSFWAPISKANIEMKKDTTLAMTRIEVLCSVCGGHLGHVFNDGPVPTGKRFCINLIAIKFNKNAKKSK